MIPEKSLKISFEESALRAGLGLHTRNQTLSEQPLHLAPEEKQAIILFLHSLFLHSLTDNL